MDTPRRRPLRLAGLLPGLLLLALLGAGGGGPVSSSDTAPVVELQVRTGLHVPLISR